MSIDTHKFNLYPEIPVERIAELNLYWEHSLAYVRNELYPETSDDLLPISVLEERSQANFSRGPNSQLLIGIAGPGAAGKGTLGGYLTNELGFSKVINTTTRDKRANEEDGIDYYFMSPNDFSAERNLGHFALSLERPGRGMYGIGHEEITRKLASSNSGCVVEENPANLMRLLANNSQPNTESVLLYVLPEYPIIENSLARLVERQSKESDPMKRMITSEIFESTLGERQIEEFLSLTELRNYPTIKPVFIINANLEESKAKLTAMFGENNEP